jgi:hypothetical protein
LIFYSRIGGPPNKQYLLIQQVTADGIARDYGKVFQIFHKEEEMNETKRH